MIKTFDIVRVLLLLCAMGLSIYNTIMVHRLIKKENFENCFGIQHNGIAMQQDYSLPRCSKGYGNVPPLGGCNEYNPKKVSEEYTKGNKKFFTYV